jgi:hypothetical protein
VKKLQLMLLGTLGFANAHAQKLPNKQEGNVRAPVDVKIDGKAVEWRDNIQGYNKPTGFYYHITNDDKSLYLVVRATDPSVARKIIGGGISFTIYTSGKKSQKDAARITFPVFEEHAKQYIVYKKPEGATANSSEFFPDSMITVNNRKLSGMAKTVSFRQGDNADTLLSVYNDHGLQAAMLFDNKMALTVEIAIDLKLINRDLESTGKILYHVESNAVDPINFNGYNIVYNADGTTMMQVTPGALTTRDFEEGPHTTDFWGEYTLAK